MKQQNAPRQTLGRQMSLAFEPGKLEGMSETERAKSALMLARILMEAVGIHNEENADDKR
ncbi:hypothetical protein AB4Z52_19715 [Rhizobium sp. 2YAF20]|uniref:hypothetical protein n=1 Tax=Rhizobium sp. 2YAF20 TaxID=3233027 RepID=UPI003F9C7FF5